MNGKILSVILFLIVAAFLIVFLRQHKPEYAILMGAVASLMALVFLMEDIVNIITQIRDLFSKVNLKSEYLSLIFKTLGICYITQFAADLCNDFGQSSLSAKVELAGKIAIFILSFPILKQVVSFTLELIQG